MTTLFTGGGGGGVPTIIDYEELDLASSAGVSPNFVTPSPVYTVPVGVSVAVIAYFNIDAVGPNITNEYFDERLFNTWSSGNAALVEGSTIQNIMNGIAFATNAPFSTRFVHTTLNGVSFDKIIYGGNSGLTSGGQGVTSYFRLAIFNLTY